MSTEDQRHSRTIVPQAVTFGSGRQAPVVPAGSDPDPVELLARLGLKPGRPVIVVAGGAKTLTGDAYELVAETVGEAIVRAAALSGAAVVDGGTAAGVMALVGEAMRQSPHENGVLLGVAPGGCVSYPGSPAAAGDRAALDPNHTHFVLAETAEWGGETALLVQLTEALAAGSPIVMVVAGGGKVTMQEVLEGTRRGWPTFVLVGSGGTADKVAAATQAQQGRRRSRPPSSPEHPDRIVQQIIRHGDVRLYERRDPNDLARRLAWELQDLEVLKLAWKAFATYDELAGKARRNFERVQAAILLLGIMATFLALLTEAIDIGPRTSFLWIEDALHWTVVAMPILIAVLVGIANRFHAGKRWVLLRGGAETVKREIYRFRTRTGIYGSAAARPASSSPQEVLSDQLDAIEAKLLQTEASSAELTPYSGPLPPEMYGSSRDDDGLSPLDPERYLEFRVGDQLRYYHPKVESLARMRRRFQFIALAAGGAGAILAAARFELWIGLTTAIGAAALAYLGYLQVESTLVAYNQSAGKLEALRRGWKALPPARRDQKAFDALVGDAETVLATELGGWVQQMNEALEEMQAKQLEVERQARLEKSEASRSQSDPSPEQQATVEGSST